ncbi:hypothetical protein Dimus_015396 [Dionaea muscipula]
MELHNEECPSSSPHDPATLKTSPLGTDQRQRPWHVPKETKEAIWGLVENAYVIDVDHKKKLLSWGEMRFKDCKSKLSREYVLPLIDGPPELLLNPPQKYLEIITHESWIKFVESRRSDEFLEKSRKNVENRKKLKHDHRLGRKGYARMVGDLPDDDKGRISGDNVYGRATAWKFPRQDKKGTYKDNATKDVADMMDESLRQIKAGTASSQGVNDPLTLALGNAEHLEELEKELEDNRGHHQLLIDTIKEKERRVEELERRLSAELDDGNQEKERRAKTLERELMQLRVELDDMRQRPASPPTPTTTDDLMKEVDDFQYIVGFSDRRASPSAKKSKSKKILNYKHKSCLKQADNKSCGYFVMRFIMELAQQYFFEYSLDSVMDSLSGKEAYSDAELADRTFEFEGPMWLLFPAGKSFILTRLVWLLTAADVDDMRYTCVMRDRQEDLYGLTALGWRREVKVDKDDAEEALRKKESTSGGGGNTYAFLDDLKHLKGNLPVASPSVTSQRRVLVEISEEDDESLITIICI